MRRILALAAIGTGLAVLAPAPQATAQTAITVCVANQSGAVLRSRLTYTDARGRQHTTAWDATALGQRSCNQLQGITYLAINVEAQAFGWDHLCERRFGGAEAMRTRTLFVTGSLFNLSCNVEG